MLAHIPTVLIVMGVIAQGYIRKKQICGDCMPGEWLKDTIIIGFIAWRLCVYTGSYKLLLEGLAIIVFSIILSIMWKFYNDAGDEEDEDCNNCGSTIKLFNKTRRQK